ncbi:hypothetical protein V5O48_014271, partial [Marasmius crinis-equi]
MLRDTMDVPVSLLRSSLRLIISQLPGTRQVFAGHVRGRLRETLPQFTSPQILFATTNPLLTHFVAGLTETCSQWQPNDELEQCLDKACGDIVQAIQALKESLLAGPEGERKEELHSNLTNLASALLTCENYCVSVGLPYPFTRAQLQVNDFIALLFPDTQAGIVNSTPTAELTVSINPVTAGSLEYVQLGSLQVPRLFNGLWQMSSPAWGCASSDKQTIALSQIIEAGLLATDMADHYGDAELIYGGFRNRLKPEVRERTIAASKWCVFRSTEQPVTAGLVFDAVQERVRRIKGKIDLLQFHWSN